MIPKAAFLSFIRVLNYPHDTFFSSWHDVHARWHEFDAHASDGDSFVVYSNYACMLFLLLTKVSHPVHSFSTTWLLVRCLLAPLWQIIRSHTASPCIITMSYDRDETKLYTTNEPAFLLRSPFCFSARVAHQAGQAKRRIRTSIMIWIFILSRILEVLTVTSSVCFSQRFTTSIRRGTCREASHVLLLDEGLRLLGLLHLLTTISVLAFIFIYFIFPFSLSPCSKIVSRTVTFPSYICTASLNIPPVVRPSCVYSIFRASSVPGNDGYECIDSISTTWSIF